MDDGVRQLVMALFSIMAVSAIGYGDPIIFSKGFVQGVMALVTILSIVVYIVWLAYQEVLGERLKAPVELADQNQ